MKRGIFTAAVLCALCAVAAAPVFSQNKAFRFGFFVGLDKLPSYTVGIGSDLSLMGHYRIGAMIEPTPKFLIKPDVVVHTDKKEEVDNLSGEEYVSDEKKTYGGGLSLLYKISSFEKSSIYVGPRVNFLISTYYDENIDGSKDDDDKTTFWSVIACIAGKYDISDHFSVFGEIGAGYGWAKEEEKNYNTSGDLTSDETNHFSSIFTYGGQVGVAFYF